MLPQADEVCVQYRHDYGFAKTGFFVLRVVVSSSKGHWATTVSPGQFLTLESHGGGFAQNWSPPKCILQKNIMKSAISP